MPQKHVNHWYDGIAAHHMATNCNVARFTSNLTKISSIFNLLDALYSCVKLRSGFLREFKSMSAYVQAIVNRPWKSDWDEHMQTNSKPNNWYDLIIYNAK